MGLKKESKMSTETIQMHLFKKYSAYNQKLLEAVQKRDFKKADYWSIKAGTVLELFRDISTQPILKNEPTTRTDPKLRESALKKLAQTKENIAKREYH